MTEPSPQLDHAASKANPWRVHTVEILDVKPEIPGVSTYNLQIRDEANRAAYRFSPGQFNMLYLPGAGEMAISVSDNPENHESCAHTIRTAGNVTRSLARLRAGDTLGLRGPFGTAWPLADCIGRDVVLVAGGIGLAPLRPIIYALLKNRRQFGRLNLLVGTRSPTSLLYADSYADWSQRGMTIHSTVDRPAPDWRGNVGVVTLLLDGLRSFDPRNTILLCCGPEVMMRFAVSTALQRGLTQQQIWVSLERNMQCAVGLCGHCQLGPAFVCKDGPVFRYSDVADVIDVESL